VEELRGVKAALLQNEQAAAVPETREFYWSKIQRQIEREGRVRAAESAPWPGRLRRWLAPLVGATALAAVLVVAVHQSPRPESLNLVSVTAEGYQARTFRDQSSGMNFVFLEDTRKAAGATGGQAQPARIREDGSSFVMDYE
jgi:hypothetical protein